MYLLKTEKSFDAAHFLKGYKGKCSNLHGHRWRVVIEVRGDHLICDGQLRDMIVDFKTLKKDVVIAPLPLGLYKRRLSISSSAHQLLGNV